MQAGSPASQQEQPALQQYFWQLLQCRSGAPVGAATPALVHAVPWALHSSMKRVKHYGGWL